MPRPTSPQLVYGSVTVVCATIALLLLTGADSPPAVFGVAVLSLALGLFAALRAPAGRGAGASEPARQPVAGVGRGVVAVGRARSAAPQPGTEARAPSLPS